ncbi:MAG: N-acetylmuramoyl-L-alanine amidase [Eubacterium sp.]|nr:N-acetylmuramoyl-L-alanine amidase [Candidatus Colimonas fimequi]
MAYLTPDKTTTINGVIVKEFNLILHNPKNIAMPNTEFREIIGVTIHNTDSIDVSPQTTMAEQYTRATYNGNMNDVRVHYYVDDVCAWQNLPLTVSGWHAADGDGDGNRKTIAIECIMTGKGTEKDKKAEANAARLAAGLLNQFGFGIDHLYTHNHWYGKKYCPAYILPHWDEFRNKVKQQLNTESKPPVIAQATSEMYRIRKTWADVASQIGAYKSLEGAKGAWKEGYYIFNSSGAIVYPPQTDKIYTKSLRQLKNGMTGEDVKRLQRLLFADGYSVGSDDGDFGPKTEACVKEFQTRNKLTADGIVGEQTFTKLWGY